MSEVRRCKVCDGDGVVCQNCRKPEYLCRCDGGSVVCKKCEGTGIEQNGGKKKKK